MTLSTTNIGEEVRLIGIDGGRNLRKRLAELGLNVGMNFKVVNQIADGPMIIAIKESRLAIGRGMADKIFVERVK
ncbi:MAG: ferrous iron transport protein A [Anaerolineaceae bacterium]|nr:ferrous iron transport protein A [Anaerolineaceae bacterium]